MVHETIYPVRSEGTLPVENPANRRSAVKRLILLGALALIAMAAFMTIGAKGSWSFVLPFRGTKLAAMILVAYSIALSTVLFQTITNNRILALKDGTVSFRYQNSDTKDLRCVSIPSSLLTRRTSSQSASLGQAPSSSRPSHDVAKRPRTVKPWR